MDTKKLKVCIFVHYSVSETLPYNVNIYINELSLYFDKVNVLTNNSKITRENSSVNSNVKFEYFENKGYDFGMIYRFLSKQNLDKFEEIAFVNDSNILLNKLDKVIQTGRKSISDFWGIIDSNEKPRFSTHADNYHIQSHFLVVNKKAINRLPSFFNQLNVTDIMEETDPKQLRRKVIDQWEIGLTQYFLSQKLTPFSVIDSEQLKLKFKTRKHNLLFSHYFELVTEGYPFVKRKVIQKTRKKHLFKKYIPIEKQLSEFVYSEWDIHQLFA